MSVQPSNFLESACELRENIEKLCRFESLNSDDARKSAEAISTAALKLRELFFTGPEGETDEDFKTRVSSLEIPFHIPYGMIQILSKSEIQCFDHLKFSLAKTIRLFIDLITFQCALQERRIYLETVEEMVTVFKKVLATLPDEEVGTWFELRCAKAATKRLDKGAGKWKELAREYRGEIFIGIVQSAFNRSPAAMVAPIINVSVAIYKNLKEQWHCDVWALEWLWNGRVPTCESELVALKSLIKKAPDNPKLAFAVAQLFRNIAFAEGVSSEVQASVVLGEGLIKGGALSMVTLAKRKVTNPVVDRGRKIAKVRDPFWKVRYAAWGYLEEIADTFPQFKPTIFIQAVKWMPQESGKARERVKSIASQLRLHAAINLGELQATLGELNQKDLSGADQQNRVDREAVEKKIASLSSQLEQYCEMQISQTVGCWAGGKGREYSGEEEPKTLNTPEDLEQAIQQVEKTIGACEQFQAEVNEEKELIDARKETIAFIGELVSEIASPGEISEGRSDSSQEEKEPKGKEKE